MTRAENSNEGPDKQVHAEPLVQPQLYGSMRPVMGCPPCAQAGSSASIELREGGMIREPCASVSHTSAANEAASLRVINIVLRM